MFQCLFALLTLQFYSSRLIVIILSVWVLNYHKLDRDDPHQWHTTPPARHRAVDYYSTRASPVSAELRLMFPSYEIPPKALLSVRQNYTDSSR